MILYENLKHFGTIFALFTSGLVKMEMKMKDFKMRYNQNDELEFEIYHKRFFIKLLLILGLPIISYFLVQDLIIRNYLSASFLILMFTMLIALFFTLRQSFEEKKKFILFRVLLTSFIISFGSYLIYSIGVEKTFFKLYWSYLFPIIVFFALGLKEGVLFTSIFCCAVVFLVIFSNFQWVSLELLKIRFLISFSMISILSYILASRMRSDQQVLLANQQALKDEIKEREQMGKALQESERRYRELTDFLPEMVYEADENGKILFANRCGFETFGYTQEDFDKGMTIFEMVIPEDREKVKRNLQRLLNGEKLFSNEYTALRKDGSTFPAISSSNLIIHDDKPIGVRGIVIEITEYKQAEKALHTERERFQSLSENAPFGMVMIGTDGTFKYINPKFTELFGYDLRDVPDGKTWFRKAYPDSEYRHDVISAWVDDLKIFKPGEKRPRTFTVTCKEGTKKIINFLPVQLESGENLMACVDITEREQAREALQRSEEAAKRLAQENAVMAEIGRIISSTLEIDDVYERFAEEVRKVIPFDRIAINIVNAHGNTATVRYATGVEIPERRIGDIFSLAGSVTYETVRTRSPILIHEEDAARVGNRFPALLPTMQAGFRSLMAVPLISKDEAIGVLHFRSTKPNAYTEMDLGLAQRVGNQIAGAIANAQLFIERKQAEEALRENEEKYRTLFEGSRDAIYITTREGMIVDANQSMVDLFRYPREEMIGLNAQEAYVHPGDREKFQEKIERNGFVRDYEIKLRKKDGTEMDCLLTSTVRRGKDGTILGYEGIIRDITEQKKAEKALEYRMDFEKLLMTISTNFIKLEPHQLDEGINQALEAISEFAGVDRSYVFLFSENGKRMDNTHEWCAPGIEPQMNRLQGIRVDEEFPWFANFIKRNEVLYVPCVADLPEEARAEKEEFKLEGTQSLIIAPMVYGASLVGFIGFDSVRTEKIWSEDIIALLQIIGEIFVNALERKRTEEKLRESEEKYRTILESIEDSYFEVDLAGNLTFFNDSACRLLGYSRHELMGMNNRQYTDPENAKKLFQAFNRVYTTGEPAKGFDWEIIRKDGTKRFIEASVSLIKNPNGEPIGFRGTVRDITERKRMEEAIRDSEARYRAIFESTGTAMLIIEEDTSISLANAETERMTGYSREITEGKRWTEFIVKEDLDKMLEYHHLRRIDPNAAPKSYEFRIIDANGNIRNIFLTISMIPKTNKSIASLLDITDLRRAEEEKATLQEQLRQSQKMEAIGRLAGGIAHDFNNLLTIIKGYSQLSLPELKEGDPVRANLEGIEKATQRATDLIHKLLAFSRRQILDMKVLDLNTVLRDLDKMLHRVIGEDIELVTLLAKDLGRVKVDPGQVEQVILNLAVNARDAMPSGGKLTIETANAALDEVYARRHMGMKSGRYVMLSVSDTGVGMSPEVKERIFEPFFTSKEKGKGTGLGLSTVYGIVKQSGGDIYVYSEPRRGTTFKIYLPTVDEPLDKVAEKAVVEELPHGGETILLVEDDEEVRKLAVQILRRQGYSVLEASHGREALTILEQQKEPIHLIVTDVVMPEISGRELAERIVSMRPKTKILYISGYTDIAIVHHGVLEPGIAFLQKPFSPSALAQKVREVLDREVD